MKIRGMCVMVNAVVSIEIVIINFIYLVQQFIALFEKFIVDSHYNKYREKRI